MQDIFENKDKKINSRRVSVVGFDICVERSSRCLERKCDGKFGNGNIRV